MIDVVYDRLIFPLLSISKLHHAYSPSGAIEMVEELVFHLVPTIDTLRWKVYVLMKAFRQRERMNCLTNKSLYALALLEVLTKWHVVLDFSSHKMIVTLEVDNLQAYVGYQSS